MNKRKTANPSMANETPSVMGAMGISLSAGESFETAVRNVAESDTGGVSELFSEAVRRSDSRESPDIVSNLNRELSDLPEEMSFFRRAMNIVRTAFMCKDGDEREAMMDDASQICLKGLSETGQRYSASLSTPCTMVFALGIMVPMIIVSMLPMLSIGGTFRIDFLDKDMLKIATLVLIPLVMGWVILSMMGKNPFLEKTKDPKVLLYLLPLALIIPLYSVLIGRGFSDQDSAFISAAICGCLCTFIMVPKMIRESRRGKEEGILKDAMFELGNRLSMGENFDTALISALNAGKYSSDIGERMSREISICRGDLQKAISYVMTPVSADVAKQYADIQKASGKDGRYAGKLALSLAHQMQQQDSVRTEISNRLKNMLDMMTGTAMFFAPLILGLSIVMLKPLSKIADMTAFADIPSVLIVYLIELTALISILSSCLLSKGRLFDVQKRFCMMMPISLSVFMVTMRLSINI